MNITTRPSVCSTPLGAPDRSSPLTRRVGVLLFTALKRTTFVFGAMSREGTDLCLVNEDRREEVWCILQYQSRPHPSLFLRPLPGSENHTQQETPLLDRVCGEVTVTDPAHPLYGQTLPQLPMRVKHHPLQVMVLLSSGRRHLVPRAATNLERSEGAASPAAPLPAISVRTILPLARLVQQLKQAKEESHAEQTASTNHPTESCVPRSHDDLSAASPEPSTATGAPGRRPHSARARSRAREGG
ncbi:DUF5372 family protein [Ktedonobacter sp. SOSP1-85]|uniref:DUF5372 family protein n=1 Tax=Ktedonobacter sp. SOSP1-85 TaxID=2778367 RepID=UPI0019168284|nr:DUF5372 family protein [Ktedonobacter sp. SOSP1-85]